MTHDDARIIGDLLLASLLAGGVRVLAMEAMRPVARWASRRGWWRLDRLAGDRLPDSFHSEQP